MLTGRRDSKPIFAANETRTRSSGGQRSTEICRDHHSAVDQPLAVTQRVLFAVDKVAAIATNTARRAVRDIGRVRYITPSTALFPIEYQLHRRAAVTRTRSTVPPAVPSADRSVVFVVAVLKPRPLVSVPVLAGRLASVVTSPLAAGRPPPVGTAVLHEPVTVAHDRTVISTAAALTARTGKRHIVVPTI